MRKTMITVFCFSVLLAAAQNADIANETQVPQDIKDPGSANIEKLEEVGRYEQNAPSNMETQRKIQLNRLDQVLLIPESGADVVGMYDPYDGTYLGDLIVNSPALMATPINAVQGPDNNIYLSDQVSDAVFVYDTLGTYLYTYADATDSLNNIRGIDFRNGHLFVTCAGPPPCVREFSAPHTFVRRFITDGSDPFDILFLEDGRALLADILGTTDNIRLYDSSGTFLYQLFSASFPEQVQFDGVLPGAFLTAVFSGNQIIDFELDGTIISTLPFGGGPRGVYRLGNGNLLASNGTGIYELDAATGAIIQTENLGSGRFIELYSIPTAQSIFWDFEDGLQGWTHTNGQAFPGAWDVVTTTYPGGPYWTYQPPPDAGDSAFIVDDDAAGSSTSTIDTAMSPVVANPGFSMLKWGYFIVYDTMEVLVREWTGTWGSWNVVAAYRGTTGPAWDSVDVSSYTGDSIQVGFHYNDEGYWSYGATFDNVGLYPALAHDVGTVSITAPPATIFPNTTIDPSATYQNFGSTAETFDVYFVIDSSGTTIYNETANITLDPGVDTTITFASWTCGAGDGIIYDITAYNYLSGDVNPSNDTITMQTITSGVGAWTQCANMPTGECANATAYDPVNDRIYSFGGTMAGGVGDYQNFTYRYDPVGNAWTTMANMPNACDWIDASYVNGKFYVIGGYNGTANNWNMIYDISGNVWSTGATLTQPRHSHQQVLYNDSLIYVLGGRDASGTAHSTVFIYNTYTDAWTTGTSMPTTCHKGGAAIIDSTIYLVGGWNNAGTALASIYVGAIDPANCENITWSTGAALPYANAAAGVIQGQRSGNWYIYMVGGFVNGATVTDEAWEYIVASNLWNQLPDYTPFSIARNNYAVHRDGYNELYVCGGGSAGTFTGTNQVWKLPWQVGIAEQPGGETPVGYGFAPMVNPTRNQAVISYNITKPGMVSLKVYDRTGRLVETLVNNTQNAGTQTVTWDARKMSNGVYFLRLEAEGNTATYKLVLVR